MVIPYEHSLKVFISGTVLYASPFCDDAVEDAILFCKENELTPDDAKIVKTYKKDSKEYDMVLVIRK